MKLVEFCATVCSAVCCKSKSSDLKQWENSWKNKEIECIKEKIKRNKIMCHQIAEKIKYGFYTELDRRPDVCLKAAKWFKAKQNAVSDKWIKIALETSKSRDIEGYKAVLPIYSSLWRGLDTLSKRRLEAWIDAVNETTYHILRLRYQRSLCHYDYKEESRRKRDALESAVRSIEKCMKKTRAREKGIESGFFRLERFPLEYIRAKMWWHVQEKLVRSRWKEILSGEWKENADDYIYSINEESMVWKSLDSKTNHDIKKWIQGVNKIIFELIDCRIYKERTTVREKICSLFLRPEIESRREASAKLPSFLLWDV